MLKQGKGMTLTKHLSFGLPHSPKSCFVTGYSVCQLPHIPEKALPFINFIKKILKTTW